MDSKNYAELDWGTKSAAPIRTERVEVTVSVDRLTRDYCKAIVRHVCIEAEKVQAEVQLTEAEVQSYLSFLLTKRCQQIAGTCTDWGKLKSLWIPSYFQWILSCVGEYRDRQYAIDVIPVMDKPSDLTLEEAFAISNKLGEFEHVLHLVRAAMPTGTNGDQTVMSCVIIDNTIRSLRRDVHPGLTYVAAFANLQLRKETAFAALYRTQYDDLDTIAMQMSLKDCL